MEKRFACTFCGKDFKVSSLESKEEFLVPSSQEEEISVRCPDCGASKSIYWKIGDMVKVLRS